MICVHTPVLPLVTTSCFPRYRCPNSPGVGIVLNRQISLPVRTSKARTMPFVLSRLRRSCLPRNDEPTSTTLPDTVGVECRPISPVSRSICWPVAVDTPTFRSTMPLVPKTRHRLAGLGVERHQPITRS